MRNIIMATVLATATVGCTDRVNPSQVQSDAGLESSLTDKTGSATSAGEWSLEKSSSGIDGGKLTATRVFNFEDRSTHLVVSIACTTGSGAIDFSIQSLVGDVASPAQESQLVSQAVGSPITQPLAVVTLSAMPQGRVRTSGGEIKDLSKLFRIDTSYGNFANFYSSNEDLRALIEKELGWSPYDSNGFLAVARQSGDINIANQIAHSLPMTVEISNGTGSFELEINAANEVATALQACGSGKPLLTESFLKKLKEVSPQVGKVKREPTATSRTFGDTIEPSESASFDCKRAETYQEKLICSDSTLARLDNAIADNYAAIAASGIGDGAMRDLKFTQREWLKARDKCADKGCLVSSYRDRIDAVCDYPVITGVHPSCIKSDEIE